MDFAPYQDTAPEHERALSPPPRRSSSRSPIPKSPPPNRPSTDPFSSSALPPPSHFGSDGRGVGGADVEGGRLNVNLFETSLPIRLDYEAMLAYLLLPPAGGVMLLVMEHKSDYVRYVGGHDQSPCPLWSRVRLMIPRSSGSMPGSRVYYSRWFLSSTSYSPSQKSCHGSCLWSTSFSSASYRYTHIVMVRHYQLLE